MPEIAFVNGEFLPLEDAVVPVEDRGFQLADAVYEVLATYGGRPFEMDRHLARLQRSLDGLHIRYDVAAQGLSQAIATGIERAGFPETLVYIQISRGVAARRHEFPPGIVPTVVMTFKECLRPAKSLWKGGVRTVTSEDQRWRRCDIKSVSLLPNVLAKQKAAAAGAFEVLLVDDRGRVTEGASTSSFCIVGGVLKTAPPGPHILPGITREVILELARGLQIPFREEFSLLGEYLAAEEVFLCGTATEVMPVVEIDGEKIGCGRPGPLARLLRTAFMNRAEGDKKRSS